MGFYKKNAKINQEGLLDIFKKKPAEIQYRLTKQGKDKLKKKLEQEQKALANLLKKDKVTESFRAYTLNFGPLTYDRTPKKEYDDMLLSNKYDINYIPNGLLFLGEYGNITYDDFDKFDTYLKKHNYTVEGGSATTDSGIIGIMIDKSFFKEYTDYTVYDPNGVNQEALISDTFKDTFKNTPGKTNKVIPLKDIDLDTLDQEVFGYLALFKGRLISFKYFIDRYKETITNLSKMVSNIDKYGKMDKEDVYKLVLHNISHISSEFNLYTPGEKGFSSIVRSDEENGIYLKTYAMYPVIKASDKYNRSNLTIDFATFGYDTTEDNEGIYGFMEESDSWVTEIANINLSNTDRKKYLNNISGIIDLNKLYSTIGEAYEFYKKIDAKKPRTYQKDTLEYKVQNVILDVYDRVTRAYHDLLEGIMSVYIKLSESTYTVSTEDIDNQVVTEESENINFVFNYLFGNANNYIKTLETFKTSFTNVKKFVLSTNFKHEDINKHIADQYANLFNNVASVKDLFNKKVLNLPNYAKYIMDGEEDGVRIKTYGIYIRVSENTKDFTLVPTSILFERYGDYQYRFLSDTTSGFDLESTGNMEFKYKNEVIKKPILSKEILATINKSIASIEQYNYKNVKTLSIPTADRDNENIEDFLFAIDDVLHELTDTIKNLLSLGVKYVNANGSNINFESIDNELVEDDNASDIDAVEATTAEIEFENTVEDSEELDELADRVDESLEQVEESLESPEEVEAIDVAVVNESLNHYFKAIGLPRENIGISTEAIKQNPVANLEAIKVELEGLGSKIKEYATAAWKKIVELFKKLVEYLTDIFNRTKFRIKRLLTTKLEIPNKEIEFTDNERLIFTFGADWLEATIGEVCNHVATVTLESLKSVIKVPRDDDSMDKLHSIKDKEFNALNKDFMIGGNISTLRLRLDAMAKGTYNDTLVKNSKLVYMYPANAGYDEITVNLLYVQPAQYKVIETIKLQAGVEDINKLFPKVESTYKDPKFLENLLKKMQSFEEPRKQFLQEIASVGIGVTQELDKLKDDKGDTANAFWETFNGYKTNLQIVLNLANGYGKITDVLLKYIERNFANKQ